MKCKICGSGKTNVIYNGPLKTGLLSGHTKKYFDVWQCEDCNTIWNEAYKEEQSDFYESPEYRKRIDGDSEAETYYSKYDYQVLDKLNMTGTDVFRHKVVADIGCAGGSFLDFVSGVASEIVAIEPSTTFQETLKKKGYHGYQYASEATRDWGNKIDVITSFDVIEHVEDPQSFVNDIYSLLNFGGCTVVGTPTDYAVLRRMLGREFDSFVFQVQHPWVLSEECLKLLFTRAGFTEIRIVRKQKYGLGNLIAWLNEKKPRGDIKYDFISETLDAAYKAEMAKGDGEYLVVYAKKTERVDEEK